MNEDKDEEYQNLEDKDEEYQNLEDKDEEYQNLEDKNEEYQNLEDKDEEYQNLEDKNNEKSKKFIKILKEFYNDLLKTFPDYDVINNLVNILSKDDNDNIKNDIYNYCKKNIPLHFFNILYENVEIFDKNVNQELYLLPNLDFISLWNENISDITKKTIWKYLQLLLFSLISDINENSFGDTAKLFEAINQDEFKQKIEDTMEEIDNIFTKNMQDISFNDSEFKNNFPSPEELNEQINSMLNGKLGNLAKEIADETAKDLDIDFNNTNSINGVFQELFKNPSKLMNLVKNVGGKLDNKIKSGEIKESELLEEASELLNNMKNIPGAGNLESMFKNMGFPGMPKGGKMDLNAMNANIQKNMKLAKMKDRMRTKVEDKDKNENLNENNLKVDIEKKNEILKSLGINEDGIEELIYKVGEPPEKSSKPAPNKKKNKKKKK